MTELKSQIKQTLEFIRTRTNAKPVIGIILGTGLGGFVKEMKKETVFDYASIPHFPVSTVESHQGKLIFGTFAGKPIVVMQGRFHLYEGYTIKQITYPIRVMKFLGVKHLLISNAAGALNPLFPKGDVMVISDHINLLGDNPLIGANDNTLGPRFPDMSEAYSKKLTLLAEEAALDLKIRLQKGVYAAMQGPNLETKAEYRFLRAIGADAVGMSTVPEDIVAVHMGIDVLAFSILTDECFPDALKPTLLEDVLKVATKAEPKMTAIMKEVIKRIKL